MPDQLLTQDGRNFLKLVGLFIYVLGFFTGWVIWG